MEPSKDGRSVCLTIGFWMEDDGAIHVTGKGVDDFHVAIKNDAARADGHPGLYRRLADCLRVMNAKSHG